MSEATNLKASECVGSTIDAMEDEPARAGSLRAGDPLAAQASKSQSVQASNVTGGLLRMGQGIGERIDEKSPSDTSAAS